jgi:hypothetical protein
MPQALPVRQPKSDNPGRCFESILEALSLRDSPLTSLNDELIIVLGAHYGASFQPILFICCDALLEGCPRLV